MGGLILLAVLAGWQYFRSVVFAAMTYDFDDWGDFEEDTETLTSGSVSGTAEFLDGDILKISIALADIAEPVIGLAFHLKYDQTALGFLRYDPGDFLERGGDPFYIVHNDAENSAVIFGATLRGDDSFPVGDGTATHFYFQILNELPSFDFGFERAVISGLDSTRQDIAQIDWQDFAATRDGQNLIFDYTNLRTAVAENDYSRFYFLAPILLIVALFFANQFRKKLAN